MRSALQAASANDKVLAERETEVTDLKTQLADLNTAKDTAADLQTKVKALETEIESVSSPRSPCLHEQVLTVLAQRGCCCIGRSATTGQG